MRLCDGYTWIVSICVLICTVLSHHFFSKAAGQMSADFKMSVCGEYVYDMYVKKPSEEMANPRSQTVKRDKI